MPASSKIIELRELLAAKFQLAPLKPAGQLTTGVTQVDTALHGGLPLGGMTEIVCQGGGGLLMQALVVSTWERRGLLALIDGADGFDPAGVPAAALPRLLWVRSQNASQAIQAADLLLRDGNLNLVVLDFRAVRHVEARQIPSTSWYRLQRVVEPSATAFVILTSQPLACGARPRVTLNAHYSLSALGRRQKELLSGLEATLQRGQEESLRQYA